MGRKPRFDIENYINKSADCKTTKDLKDSLDYLNYRVLHLSQEISKLYRRLEGIKNYEIYNVEVIVGKVNSL